MLFIHAIEGYLGMLDPVSRNMLLMLLLPVLILPFALLAVGLKRYFRPLRSKKPVFIQPMRKAS